MTKTVRRISLGIGVVFALVAVIAIYVGYFFDLNHYKPQVEAAAMKSTGMKLNIAGKASLKILPRISLELRDVHLSNRGSELFTEQAVDVMPRLAPLLLHRRLVVDRVSLNQPKVRVEKSASGRMNYETTQRSSEDHSSKDKPGEVHSLKIRGGEVSYIDREKGTKIQLNGIDLNLAGIAWSAEKERLKSISFQGDFGAKSLQAGALTAANLKSGIHADQGLVRLDPTEMSAFGGPIHGSAQIDLRSAVPKLDIQQSAPHVELAQVPSRLQGRIAGTAAAAVNLSASGNEIRARTRTASGTVSVRSQNVTINGFDVDELASKLKSAQGLDLLQIGSALFPGKVAGPTGGAPGKKSVLRNLVFDWKLSQGIAQQDVAFSTPKNNIVAFKGGIDLRDETYHDFSVATVNSKGCAKEEVGITGSLSRPRPNASSVGQQISRSYLGQAGSEAGQVGSQIAKKAPSAGCDPFYSGAALRGG